MKWPLVLIILTAFGGLLAILAGLIWRHKEEIWIGTIVIILMVIVFVIGRITHTW